MVKISSKIQKKQQSLNAIAAEIACCKICQKNKIGVSVPGEGNPDAAIVFLGEAPGKQEAITGRPFIGRSGKVLRDLIGELGLTTEEVFITSPVKYLPEYVTPTPEDIVHGKVHLEKQLAIIEPKVIVLLGRVAALAVLGNVGAVLKNHGTVIEQDGRNYFVTIHPAAPLYAPKLKSVLVADFKKLKLFLKRQATPAKSGSKN